jgi:HTH-type transcriptional repressor of NAD biosynthesis genes
MKQGEGSPTGRSSGASVPQPIALVESVRRIVIVGAESTGTTTLARDLADRMSAPWAPEFLREYADARANEAGTIWDVVWTSADFDRVAEGQDELEHAAISRWTSDPDRYRAGPHGPLVICDTDALATAMWARRYLGTPATRFLRQAAARPPALYLLTSPDGVDFFQDGLRDGEHIRGEMTDWFRTALRDQQVPWVELTCDQSTRIDLALRAIDELVDEPSPVNPKVPNEQR